MQRRTMKIIGLGLYVTMLMAILESVARLVIARPVMYLEPDPDPELLYRLKSGRSVANGTLFKIDDFVVYVDAHHCRVARGGDSTPMPGHRRILFLGDSFTFSQGVDYERSYPYRVEQALNTARSGAPVQVIDCAVDGYNFTQIVRSAEIRLPEFEPDLLVVPLFRNDLNEPFQLQKMFPRHPVGAWFIRHVRLIRLAVVVRHARDDAMRPTPLAAATVASGVDRILDAAGAARSRVLFLLLSEVPHPEVAITRMLDDRGAAWLRLPDFHTPALTFPRNGHWNREGHRRVADWLAPRIAATLDGRWDPGRKAPR